MLTMNWNPSERQLRQFSWLGLIAFPLLAYLWGRSHPTAACLVAGCGVTWSAVGLVWPRGVKPLFLTLSLVGLPVGKVLGETMLLIVFYGIFLPVGLLLRLFGRDALQRKIDTSAVTYWEPKEHPSRSASYLCQW